MKMKACSPMPAALFPFLFVFICLLFEEAAGEKRTPPSQSQNFSHNTHIVSMLHIAKVEENAACERAWYCHMLL